jgi:hypothetical protein
MGAVEGTLEARARDVRAALAARLPVSPSEAPRIRATLEEYAPEELRSMVAQADAVVRHRFDLLGSGPCQLPPQIDWHCDFKSGYRWNPAIHHSGISFGAQRGVDVKVPWELSRCQHLPLLAQAYLMTGRSHYADEAIGQIRHWIAANPPEFGVNWVCPMDVAIRVVNWLWTVALVADSTAVSDQFLVDFIASMLAHGRYLRSNLEVMPDGTRTNHYIADLVGLLYLGLTLKELDVAREWGSFAIRELEAEMERQVLPDGVNFESSIPYHRLVAEMFLSSALLAKHHGVAFAPSFLERLRRMMDFTTAYTKPNGLAPQAGDADDGRLHVLSGHGRVDPRDHRHLLAAASMLFCRDDWYQAAGPRWVEALWLGGASRERNPPACSSSSPESAAFKDGGFYFLRKDDDFVMLTAGSVGTGGLGNHKHNDLLAIEVHLGGEDILIDPGTYLYTPQPEARNAFRSTRAHTTVMVDGVEQNTIPAESLFSLHSDACPSLVEWTTGARETTIIAEHDGYRRLPAPVIHRRLVTLSGGGAVTIEDTLVAVSSGAAAHDLAWTFAFAPGCRVSSTSNGWSVVTGRGRNVTLTAPRDAGGLPIPIVSAIEAGSVSPSYGVAVQATVLRWRWRGPLPMSVRLELRAAPDRLTERL